MAAAAALVLAGCWGWSAPRPDEPAEPVPVETAATPLDPEALALAAERCAATEAAPAGTFETEIDRSTWVLPNGTTIQVSLLVPLRTDHGKHTVSLEHTQGSVLDGDRRVVGIVDGLAAHPGSSGPGVALGSAVVVSLGACPGGGIEVGVPLPDGDYQLVLFGPINPVDHDHATQEHWVTPGLDLSVADGEILAP